MITLSVQPKTGMEYEDFMICDEKHEVVRVANRLILLGYNHLKITDGDVHYIETMADLEDYCYQKKLVK